ncbi:11361_t:CDS:2 [Scutellospora calospora]|uniref:11361_t:CDS:1 n=1 Tax=Scutellospora calospora TaxID=85575 RepID=A0ACA9MEJ0_9GLOM|nr:11361_t:CDS:2 [Scutellospora calospora]
MWTSGNKVIDEFIQGTQLKALNFYDAIEWIQFNKLKDIKYLDRGGFSKVYSAIWTDVYITSWDHQIKQWKRYGEMSVALKCLDNSHNKFEEFLQESHINIEYGRCTIWCHGLTRDPETNNFMMVLECLRPSIKSEIPYLFNQLINQCWDTIPINRPNASTLLAIINNWKIEIDDPNSELYVQIKKIRGTKK